MAKTPKTPTADAAGFQPLSRNLTIAGRVLDPPEATLVDVIDQLLNKGVVLTGDVTLGVAGIDLIYLRLSSILCAVDRLLPARVTTRRASRHRKPSKGRNRR
jgi:gas vesicle structural protein